MKSDKLDVANSCSKGDAAFDADAILQHLGSTGWFQFRFFICLAYAVLFPTATILVFNFTGATPAHRCFIDGCDNAISPQYLAEWMDVDLVTDLQMNPKQWRCEFPKFAILPDCANITANASCGGWIFDKSIFSSTIVTDFLLVCNDSWKPMFVSSLTMGGIMAGAFFLGPLPDLIGRRKSVLILSIWMSMFGFGLSFSRNYEEFAVLRFLNGMGCIALMQALAIWGVEAMASDVRVKFIFVIYCFQSLGNLLTGLLAYFVRDWVPLQLYLFVPMTVTVSYFFVLPESTRWLTVNKRYDEAKKIYEQAALLNNRKIPPHMLLIPVDNAPERGNPVGASTISCNEMTEDANAWISIWHVFKTPCLLKRLLILICAWASAMLSYYGLSYSASNLSNEVHLNFVLIMYGEDKALWDSGLALINFHNERMLINFRLVEIPAYLIGMFAVDLLGRRTIINMTLMLGGTFCLLAGLVPHDYYWLIVGFSLTGKFFISMQLVTVNVITAELFPTASRGFTIGLCSTMGKAGGIFAPVMSAMGAANHSLPYVLFGGINLTVGMLSLMLPETKDLPIPATIQDAKDLELKTLDLFGCCRKRQQHSTTTVNTSTNSI